jgi:hypothetical protein
LHPFHEAMTDDRQGRSRQDEPFDRHDVEV